MVKTTDIGRFYYYFPQAVTVVGVDRNVMPVAWHTPISAQPPLFGILVSPKRYTYSLLKQEDGFTVNFMDFNEASLIAKIGGTSGRDIDKLKKFKIAYKPGEEVNGVIITSSYAAYECEKHAEHVIGDHSLFVGKIIVIHYRKEIITLDGLVDEKKLLPMLYFGKDRYITVNPQTTVVHKRG